MTTAMLPSPRGIPPIVYLLALASPLLAACGSPGAGAPAPAPASEPARITYGPFLASYRAASHGHVEQEFGGQVDASDFTMSYYITAGVVRSTGVHRISLTVDSVPELSGQALSMSQSDKDRVAGTIFTGILTSTGEIVNLRGGDTTIALVQTLADGLQDFLPRIPEGGAQPGDAWTDTTESISASGAIDMQIRSVSRHEAIGWIEHAGERALHLVTLANYTFTGSGFQMGQELTIDGSGVRHENHYLAPGGRYLGATVADTSNSTALLTAVGVSIPIKQTRSDTVRIIR